MSETKKELEKIVGAGNVKEDEQSLSTYIKDNSFVPARKPDMVVFVKAVEQVQQVLKFANSTKTPVVPYSSGKNMHGATIADQGGIIMDMSGMKNIIALNEDDWYVVIEPGVTYSQLQDFLSEKGYCVMAPFGVHPERSVLSSYLERDPVMAAPSFEHGNYLIMDTEIVLPNGDLFKTGNWASGGEPGAPSGPIRNTIFRLWTGSQGTLGVLTKMVIQIEPLHNNKKLFFIPFDNLPDTVEPLKLIQRREIGTECFILNSLNLASLLNDSWQTPMSFPVDSSSDREEFESLRKALPNWTIVVCINGHIRRSDEKIAYETEALQQICDNLNISLLSSLPNVSGADKKIFAELLRPWGVLKKFNYKGSVHDITFKAPLKKLSSLKNVFEETASACGFPLGDLGYYIMPVERGRGVHCEFDLHCCPDAKKTEELWLKASSELMNSGAYFDRPYGQWASMVYERAAGYSGMLKKIKKEMDPNNILNPGKLCFS